MLLRHALGRSTSLHEGLVDCLRLAARTAARRQTLLNATTVAGIGPEVSVQYVLSMSSVHLLQEAFATSPFSTLKYRCINCNLRQAQYELPANLITITASKQTGLNTAFACS